MNTIIFLALLGFVFCTPTENTIAAYSTPIAPIPYLRYSYLYLGQVPYLNPPYGYQYNPKLTIHEDHDTDHFHPHDQGHFEEPYEPVSFPVPFGTPIHHHPPSHLAINGVNLAGYPAYGPDGIPSEESVVYEDNTPECSCKRTYGIKGQVPYGNQPNFGVPFENQFNTDIQSPDNLFRLEFNTRANGFFKYLHGKHAETDSAEASNNKAADAYEKSNGAPTEEASSLSPNGTPVAAASDEKTAAVEASKDNSVADVSTYKENAKDTVLATSSPNSVTTYNKIAIVEDFKDKNVTGVNKSNDKAEEEVATTSSPNDDNIAVVEASKDTENKMTTEVNTSDDRDKETSEESTTYALSPNSASSDYETAAVIDYKNNGTAIKKSSEETSNKASVAALTLNDEDVDETSNTASALSIGDAVDDEDLAVTDKTDAASTSADTLKNPKALENDISKALPSLAS
ncbi:unnamed protein product [Brassicogethes aeneus]|uniref:Uncharacterized protein n=1 Tax=Brassicogethes aeneus TaxID=1431903 RepID=A0A9P0FC71_BRAAE|nr:unnamed protein product [Brassicogethes aeneus]